MRRSKLRLMIRFFTGLLTGLLSVLLLGQPRLLAQTPPIAPSTRNALPRRAIAPPTVVPTTIDRPNNRPSNQPKLAAPERRGVWLTNIDSDVLFKAAPLKAAIDTLADLNFNTLYPVVWNFGYTFYPSVVAQRATGFRQAPGLDRDMLAELIPQAHAKKLLVIPWFEFGFMAPETSDLALNHPDWLTNTRSGETVWLEGGEPRVWLNPFLPEVQDFITDLVMETVAGYDIDGIQFDDHFGLPNTFGYDETTIALYRQEHAGKVPPSNPENPEWIRWRADKITDFTTRLVRAIKAQKPKVIFSLSPNPYDFAYQSSLQDWRTWQQKGLLDELIIQVYVSSLDSFQSHLRRPEVQAAARQIPVSIGVLSGLRGKKVPFDRIQRQVQAVRQAGLSGVSFFFYETLWNVAHESKRDRQAAFRQLFPNPSIGIR